MRTLTADAGYAHGANYAALEDRDIEAVVPPQRPSGRKSGTIRSQQFKYDAELDVVRCPRRRTLLPSTETRTGRFYRARRKDCRDCPLQQRCLSKTAKVRLVHIGHGHTALLRARRRKAKGWDKPTRRAYRRHRWRVEGVHGEAKTQHGLRRATRRGLANMAIQSYLTAAVMNLKRLAAFILTFMFAGLATITRQHAKTTYKASSMPNCSQNRRNLKTAA